VDRAAEAFGELLGVIARLRGPAGCPWDRAQTHCTLIPYLLEEAYEVADSLTAEDYEHQKEELGDLLLQVLLHAQIEAEAGHFDIGDVATALREKLIRRHPHVFGEAQADTPHEVRRRWEELKRQEGRGLDLARPALLSAHKFLELREGEGPPLGRYLKVQKPSDPEATVGEMLLEVVALAMNWGVEPELALHKLLSHLAESHGT
jgi:XTP/dITP diphosphohydrolase